jgi:hypothetical protein
LERKRVVDEDDFITYIIPDIAQRALANCTYRFNGRTSGLPKRNEECIIEYPNYWKAV